MKRACSVGLVAIGAILAAGTALALLWRWVEVKAWSAEEGW